MIRVKVGEPTQKSIGDFWFDPTTRCTHRYSIINSGVLGSTMWVKEAPSPYAAFPRNPNKGDIHIEPVNCVPNLWDGNSWIPAVPSNYLFPPVNPIFGEQWTEPMTQLRYDYTHSGWRLSQLIATQKVWPSGAAGAAIPIPSSNGSTGAGTLTNNILSHSTVPAALHASSNVNNITITGPTGPLVTIDTLTGALTYGPSYTPDAAAQIFWKALTGSSPRFLQSQIDELVKDLKDATSRMAVAEGNVLRFTAAGFKLPEPPKPFDPNQSWDNAMGIIK